MPGPGCWLALAAAAVSGLAHVGSLDNTWSYDDKVAVRSNPDVTSGETAEPEAGRKRGLQTSLRRSRRCRASRMHRRRFPLLKPLMSSWRMSLWQCPRAMPPRTPDSAA